MSRTVAFATLILLSIGLMNAPQTALADEPTAESILKKVPKLSSESTELKNFSARARINTPTPGLAIVADVAWVRDKGQTFILYNPTSGLPIALYADGQMVMYDVIAAKILVIEKANGVLDLQATDEKVSFGFGFNSTEGRIHLDLASFYKCSGDATLEQNDNAWLLTSLSKSGKSKLVGKVLPGQEWPLHEMELLHATENQVLISISNISVNKPDGFQLRPFPAPDKFPQDVKVDRLTKEKAESFCSTMGAMAKWLRVIYGHAALAAPELRDNPLGVFVDWNKAAEAEKALGPAFRKIIDYKEPPVTANATDADAHRDDRKK